MYKVTPTNAKVEPSDVTSQSANAFAFTVVTFKDILVCNSTCLFRPALVVDWESAQQFSLIY